MARRLDVGLIDGRDVTNICIFNPSIKLEGLVEVLDENCGSFECGRVASKARI